MTTLLSKKKIPTLPVACSRPARDIINDSMTPMPGGTWQDHFKRVRSNAGTMAPKAELREVVDKLASEISVVTPTIIDLASLERALRLLKEGFRPVLERLMTDFDVQMEQTFPKGPTPTFEEFSGQSRPEMVAYITFLRHHHGGTKG